MKRSPFLIAFSVAAVLLGILLGVLWVNFSESSVQEHERKAMESSDTRPILVIVPHPDDEAFGFSGTLGAAVTAGAPVRVFLLSDGEYANIAEQWVQEHLDSGSSAGLSGDLNNDGVIDRYDFGAARRGEFKSSMEVLGILEDDVVFLGNAYGDAPGDFTQSAEALAEYIRFDSEQAGFPLDNSIRIFTVAPQLGDDDKAIFYGENYGSQIPQLHNVAAETAWLLGTSDLQIDPSNVYLFKVYAHGKRKSALQAPIVFVPSDEATSNRRKQSIEQYANLGKKNAPYIYRGALQSNYEYAATLRQIIDAGFELQW